jgi:hypothetical protein
MALVCVEVYIKRKAYIVQEVGTVPLEDAISNLLDLLYKGYVCNRAIICDDENRIINKNALLKWFTKRALHVSVHRGLANYHIRSPIGRSRLTGVHCHFYLTYGRGTKRQFTNRWVVNSMYLRIECMIGETLGVAVRRDGRIKLTGMRHYCFLTSDRAENKLTYIDSHVITRVLRGKSFLLSYLRKLL